MPANFKTYEAQARLLAAVVAAHPDLKLNYKSIADHYGKSQTVSAIEHRFRPMRAAAQVLRTLVKDGKDPDIIEDIFDKKAIAEHFGESTADGIQFQFRGVKQSAEALKKAVEEGTDPATAFASGKPAAAPAPAKATPRKRGRAEPKSNTSTPAGKTDASPVGTGNSSAKPRRTVKNVKYKEESSEETESPLDYSELDTDSSPSKFVKKPRLGPSKLAVPAQPGPASSPRQQHKPAAAVETSPSDSSIQTPDNLGNDEVTFLKHEVVNNNSAVNSFPSFTQSSQGESIHVSNPGSFSNHPQSIFGGPSRAPPPQYQQHVAPGKLQNSFPATHALPTKISEASTNLREVFGGRTVDWTMSNHDIFQNSYYDDPNGDI